MYLTLDLIYSQYYSKLQQEVFEAIVVADPTTNPKKKKMGQYCKWLLKLYVQNNLLEEDLYKATEYLTIFNSIKHKLQYKDINFYKNLNELFQVIQPYYTNPEDFTSKSEEIREIKKGALKWYEDDQWIVIIPQTEEASCYYGRGTQWCTAAIKSNNYFSRYSSEGPLYININKQTGRKYQFHFESNQFMDETDCSISIFSIGLTNALSKLYIAKQVEALPTKEQNRKILLTSNKELISVTDFMNCSSVDVIGIVWDEKNRKALSLDQTIATWSPDGRIESDNFITACSDANKDMNGRLNCDKYLSQDKNLPTIQWCNELETKGTSKGDWYLMSGGEWADAISSMDKWFSVAQIFGFSKTWYWTSSVYSPEGVWVARLYLSSFYYGSRHFSAYVRACLAF